MKTVTLHVEGMSCDHCVKSVQEALEYIGAQARVSLSENRVEADFDESRLNVNALKSAIEDQGYDVLSIEE